jgi:hypothetical protein
MRDRVGDGYVEREGERVRRWGWNGARRDGGRGQLPRREVDEVCADADVKQGVGNKQCHIWSDPPHPPTRENIICYNIPTAFDFLNAR